MNQSWQDQRERSTPLALYTIRWIALNVGRPAARSLLYPISIYFFLFAPEKRKASRAYLTRVLTSSPSSLDVIKHIHCFASTILDRVYLLTGQFNKLDITFPAINVPLEFSHQGSGCILLGSHIGSFEVLRSYAVRKCPLPIKILMHEGHSPMIMKILHSLNSDISKMLIHLDSPECLLEVKDAVDSGFAVGMMGDRIFEISPTKTVRCKLLGKEIELSSAPVLMAASLKVPLIAFFGIYLGGNRYQIHFEIVAEGIVLNRKNRQHDIQKWMQKYADLMEKHIKAHPYNWFNFYDYWEEF